MKRGGFGIRKKKVKKNKKIACIGRGCCIHHKVDDAAIKYLEENPDLSFSKLVETILKEKLTETGHYTKI